MKLARMIKGYLFLFLLFLATAFLVINIVTYIQNQRTFGQMLESGGVYSLPDDLARAERVTDIVYRINGNGCIPKSHIICATAAIIRNGGACGERVFLEVSMLRMLDIPSRPLGLMKSSQDDGFSHVVVEADVNGSLMVLDPSFNSTFAGTADGLKDTAVFEEYRQQIKENTGLDYPEEYDYNDTAYFRYGVLGPFKNMGIAVSRVLSLFGLTIYQYYFLLRCELRNIVISVLAIFVLVAAAVFRPVRQHFRKRKRRPRKKKKR